MVPKIEPTNDAPRLWGPSAIPPQRLSHPPPHCKDYHFEFIKVLVCCRTILTNFRQFKVYVFMFN